MRIFFEMAHLVRSFISLKDIRKSDHLCPVQFVPGALTSIDVS